MKGKSFLMRMVAGLLVLFMLFTVPDTNVKSVYGAEDEDEDVSFDDASDIFSLDAKKPKEMESLPGSVYDNTGMTPFLLVEQNELYFLTNGEKGEKGDKGDKGDKGEPGSSGSNGLSAYEIAVRNGYTGTESEWVNSLGGGGITIVPVSPDENGYVVGFEFVFPNGYKLLFSGDGLLYMDENEQIIFQMRPEVFPDPSPNQNP